VRACGRSLSLAFYVSDRLRRDSRVPAVLFGLPDPLFQLPLGNPLLGTCGVAAWDYTFHFPYRGDVRLIAQACTGFTWSKALYVFRRHITVVISPDAISTVTVTFCEFYV
jgi:hypothetical protein